MKDIEKMYNDNFQMVYKYLLIMTHDEDLAEELTQETFYKAVKNINKFKENSKISTWLCTIAKNLYLAEINKSKRYKPIEENDASVIEDEKIFSAENKLKLFKNIQELNPEMRDVIHLRLSGELSFKEIGEIMNKTENWARVTFYRGKEKLKEVDEDE